MKPKLNLKDKIEKSEKPLLLEDYNKSVSDGFLHALEACLVNLELP